MLENKILNDFLSLNIGEVNNFISQLENIFNISKSDIHMNIQSESTVNSDSDELKNTSQEKTFSIKLKSYSEEKKFSVMKTIKSLFSLTLKETTDILINLPYILKKTTSEKEANQIKKEIEEMGGVVVIE